MATFFIRHLSFYGRSGALQGEVALKTNERWLRRVWFLENCPNDFLVQASEGGHLLPV